MSQNSWSYLRRDAELTCNTNHRYVPVMITRLMISLRKAARSRGSHWSMAESTVNGGPEIHSMRFAINLGTFNRQDDDTLLSPISPRL